MKKKTLDKYKSLVHDPEELNARVKDLITKCTRNGFTENEFLLFLYISSLEGKLSAIDGAFLYGIPNMRLVVSEAIEEL